MKARFRIIPTDRGNYIWQYLSRNNRVIVQSSCVFLSKNSCMLAIELARKAKPVVRDRMWSIDGAMINRRDKHYNIQQTARAWSDDVDEAKVIFMGKLARPWRE